MQKPEIPEDLNFSDTTACRSLEPGGLILETDWCGCPVYGTQINTSIQKVIKKNCFQNLDK
jgi:hypothetical protein